MSAIDAETAARELGISYDLFLRTRKALEARGFPRPLPLVSRAKRGRPPLRWSLDAIRDWIRAPAAPRPAAARDNAIVEERLG
jgi:predicted ArsR family transcriptional regulator